MGGASASAVPAASAIPAASTTGGYASPGAMSAATVKGTTGSNIAGMGYVPRAQLAGPDYWSFAGKTLADVSKQFGKSMAEQKYDLGGAGSQSPYVGPAPFPFMNIPKTAMPQVRSAPFQIASATGGPLRQTGIGYTI